MGRGSRIAIVVGGAVAAALGVVWAIYRIKKSKMSKYFTFGELCHSDTAAALSIDNTPTSAVIVNNLDALMKNMLDPVREAYGDEIVVSSGYRCSALNKAVGGASNSQHLSGCAADLVGKNRTRDEVVRIFLAALKVGGYDQLILEHSGGAVWVHVSWVSDKSRRRGQVLDWNGSRYATMSNPATDYLKYV